MRFSKTLFAGVALTVCGLTFAAPIAEKNYWPMTLGSTWSLKTMVKDSKKPNEQPLTMTQEIEVVTVKKDGDATIATLDYKSEGRVINREVYRVTEGAIERTSSGVGEPSTMTPPFPMVKYPLTPGKTWKWQGTILARGQTIKAESTLTVTGPVDVKTAAGSFKTMKVHSALVVDPEKTKYELPNDYWFADGVGLVKQGAKLGDKDVLGELTKYKVK
jgi:hypothetical protein